MADWHLAQLNVARLRVPLEHPAMIPFVSNLWAVNAEADAASRKEQRRADATARNKLSALKRPLEQRLKKVEAEMQRIEPVLAALETKLVGPDIYTAERKDELKASVLEQAELKARLATLEGEWLEIHEQIEAVTASA